MLLLVTGGTGYVGSHSIAALVGAGHRVRVLARSPERIPAALAPLGVDDVETAIGDVTDPAAVERALEGCDAVLHAASVFSMDARRAEEMRAVRRRGDPLPFMEFTLTMEVSGRHARTRAIIGDTISPANWVLQATKMRRETSRVSFLMCPFCVRRMLLG